ncbi:MAG: S1 RNA-binding domain-containing protein [Pirellulaceae bacterium]
MTSQSTDSHQDPAPNDERADVTPNPTDAAESAAGASDGGQEAANSESESPEAAAERRKIKIGSQREGSPKLRMERRHYPDATVAPPAVQVPESPKPTAPPVETKTEQPQAAPPAPTAETPVPAMPPALESTSAVESTAAAESSPAASAPASPPPAEQPTSPPPAAPAPPQRAGAAIHVPKKGPVSVPRKTDLDDELEAALGGMSLDDIIAKDEKPQTGAEIEPETRRRGIVVRVQREDVFFSLGARHEGVAPRKNFPEPPEPGTQMDVIISRFNGDEGLYELHIPGAAADVSDWGDISDGSVVEARITGSNTGGLECQVNNIRGFIPASQISMYRVENLGEYVGQKLLCVVTEVNPARKNLVLSHRAILEREKEEAREGLLQTLSVGEVREGTVRSLRDFGAFVDIGGLDGLIHISKLSWDHVKHPSDVLKEGQQVQVKIEKIDRQTGKIGLSYRDLLEDPWKDVVQKFPSGAVVDGVVTRVTKFGAFVKLEPGVEGLVHISELAHHRVVNVSSYLQEGQPVQVKVVSVDPDAQRIGLSMKALVQEPVKASGKTQDEEEDDTPRELAVPKREGPLKGGVDKPSGGEKFGLNW